MNEQNAVAILNELLGAEQKSVARRLLESTVFVSAGTVSDQRMIDRLAAMSSEHESWLMQSISGLGGAPAPRVLDVLSADLHFQGLGHAMQRLREDLQRLVATYEAAAQRLISIPQASTLAGEILDRHRHELDEINERQNGGALPIG